MMRQVLLRRPVEGGHAEEVCWIDNALARVGKRVAGDDGVVWTVGELYGAKEYEDVDRIGRVAKRFCDVLDGH